MENKIKYIPGYIKLTFILILLYLLFNILFHAQAFLIPFAIACLFSFLLLPISLRLEKWHVPRIPAIILSILVAIILFFGLIFFFSMQVMSFREDLPELKIKLKEKFEKAQTFIEKKMNISERKQDEFVREKKENIVDSSGDYIMNFFSATGTFLAMFALIPIYIFFLTYYRQRLHDFIIRISDPPNHRRIEEIIAKISKIMQSYLAGLLIDIAILSVLNTSGFLLLGIEHAVLLGVLAAVLNIIPYIGVLIGGLFPVIMALLTKDSIWIAVGAAGVCIFVQFIDNNFITPKVVGSSVSLNPLSTLLVLLIGGFTWGVAGMMMFIPFLGMVKVVFDHVDSLKPYGYVIGNEKAPKEEIALDA